MLKKPFIAGLLVWLPVLATFFILKFLISAVDGVVRLIPAAYRPDVFFGHHIPGVGLVLTLIIIFITGLITTNFLGKHLVNLSERILAKIPLVRSIYSATKQVVQSILSPSHQSFSKAVLVEFPRKGVWSIGFVTNKAINHIPGEANKTSVFVPTAPNPTSGFFLMMDASEMHPLSISVEEAFKMVVSVGVIAPP